jgi:AGZA family xanthine/uracil permease-like MFS transporter
MNLLNRYFRLEELGTNVRTEVIAGITTFMTMAYIVFVNPAILSAGGVPFEGAVVATCIASGLITILMGLFTNYPLALACGMGLNAMVSYTIVLSMGETWQVGMGVIVVEGLLVLILSMTNLRTIIMEAIPQSLKYAIGVAIGLFIALIGLKDAGIIVFDQATLLKLGDLTSGATLLALVGLLITAVLVALRVPGALLIGILATAVIAAFPPFHIVERPESIFALPRDFSTMFRFDAIGALKIALIPVIFAFFMTDFFDTMGTAIGIGKQAGFLDSRGNIPRLKQLLVVDSLGAVTGGVLGCSSVTSYIESAAGVSSGGRSGLTVVVTGLLFFVALFFTPIIAIVGGGYEVMQEFVIAGERVLSANGKVLIEQLGAGGCKILKPGYLYPITAPALIIVGFLMFKVITEINFAKIEEGLPAFLVILVMPLTLNISYGIGFGFISFSLIKLLIGKGREVHPLMYVVSLLFALCFISPWLTKIVAGT